MTINTANMVSTAKTNWAGVGTIILAIWNQLSPTLVNLITNHPHVTFWTAITSILAAFYVQPAPTTATATAASHAAATAKVG
jgi:hypothetical protein